MRSNWKLLGLIALALCLFGCFVAANSASLKEQPIDIIGEVCTITLNPPGTPDIGGTILSATDSFIEVKAASPKGAKQFIYYVLPLHSVARIKFVQNAPGKDE